eukprot:184719-Rhodomonas_salina.1
MGMLGTAVFILAMNNFGPIADNAGGIVEMSEQSEAGESWSLAGRLRCACERASKYMGEI